MTLEDDVQKQTTFTVSNGEPLSLLISALRVAEDNYAGDRWELHINLDD